jgi:RNA polymerase sigma factor (sigma-70 family)
MQKVVQYLRRIAARQEVIGKPDGELVKRYVTSGDEAAFEALVRRHGPMVFGVCRRHLHNLHDAEDAFQATFLVLVCKAATLRRPGMVGNWLYGVACRTALHAKRLNAKRREKEAAVPARMDTPKDVRADLLPVLDQELERLAEKYRALVVLCDLEGRTRREVATLLGLPEGTIASRLARGRALLAARLTRRSLAVSGTAMAGALFANATSAGVPPSLMISTLKAASAFASGSTAMAAVPAAVMTLAQGVLKMMLITKVKYAVMVILALGLLTGSGVGIGYHALGRGPHTVSTELMQDAQEATKNRQAKSQDSLKTKKTQEARIPFNVFALRSSHGESMVQVIKEIIEPESWKHDGVAGATPGRIVYYPAGKSIVISSTPEIRDQVATLLTKLEELALEAEERQLRDDLEDQQRKRIIAAERDKEYTRRYYAVGDLSGKDGDPLIKIITETIEASSWIAKNGKGSVQFFPEGKSLVVYQTPEVHSLVASLLEELRQIKKEQERKGK